MSSSRSILFALLLPLACSQNLDAEEATSAAPSALLAYSETLWPMKDGAATIRVCWKPLNLGGRTFFPAEIAPNLEEVNTERRRWVQEVVEAEWNAKTVLKFVGWKSCGEEPADVEIDPISSVVVATPGCSTGQSCSDSFGTKNRGKQVHINVLFGDEVLYLARYKRGDHDMKKLGSFRLFVPKFCSDEFWALARNPTTANEDAFVAEWKTCLQNTALHEFGHVAGFAHEWYRKDDAKKAKDCLAAEGITDLRPSPHGEPDTPLGPFDSESIMSYCRRDKSATLTAQDIEQTNDVYRRLAPKLPSDPVSETENENEDEDEDEDANELPEDTAEPPQAKRQSTERPALRRSSTGGCNG